MESLNWLPRRVVKALASQLSILHVLEVRLRLSLIDKRHGFRRKLSITHPLLLLLIVLDLLLITSVEIELLLLVVGLSTRLEKRRIFSLIIVMCLLAFIETKLLLELSLKSHHFVLSRRKVACCLKLRCCISNLLRQIDKVLVLRKGIRVLIKNLIEIRRRRFERLLLPILKSNLWIGLPEALLLLVILCGVLFMLLRDKGLKFSYSFGKLVGSFFKVRHSKVVRLLGIKKGRVVVLVHDVAALARVVSCLEVVSRVVAFYVISLQERVPIVIL